jgi:uncharacterized protein
MKRFASLLLLTLLLPLAARADEASHKAKAEEMIVILHLDRMVNGVMQNALQQSAALTNQRYGGKMTPAATASLNDFQKKLTGVLEPQIGWEALKPDYVRIFTETFPEDQLDSMLAFYKSPAGKNLVEKLPPVEQQVGQILQKRVAALQPQVKQMFDDFQKSLPANTPEATPGAVGPAPSLAPSTPPATTPGKTTPK